jgi:arginine exporter protein ArgO
MTALLIISTISAAGIAFLIYFGFALLHDYWRAPEQRVLIVKLRERFSLKKPRLLHSLDSIRPHQSARAKNV